MAKVVSQETYDSVVLENCVDFELSCDEAHVEAQKEFDAQGVHLGIIVKDGKLSADKKSIEHDILIALGQLKTAVAAAANGSPSLEEVKEPLATFTTACKVSVAHRVLANNNGAYDTLLKLIKQCQGDTTLLCPSLQAMVALTEFNPDIVTAEGYRVLLQLLEEWSSRLEEPAVPEYLAQWCMQCCVKHEDNRQSLVSLGALGALVSVLQAHRTSSRVVRGVCKALRAFTLDDDVRQAFGKAHEHARLLAEDHNLIAVCLEFIKEWLNDADTTSELLSSVAKLCVRAEYCQEAFDRGALLVINDVLISFPDRPVLNKQALSLLKALVGNDRVKEAAMKSGVSQLIVAAMTKHQMECSVCEEACGAVSMLALRVPAHAKQLVQDGAGQAVVKVMEAHPKAKQLQKLGCMAIRNMVSRLPENKRVFAEYGVEGVIHTALKNHGEAVKDVARAALRDLDLKVELVEQWRGTGHEISR